MMICPICDCKRTIKIGKSQQKIPKQKYYCYECRSTFRGPLIDNTKKEIEQ